MSIVGVTGRSRLAEESVEPVRRAMFEFLRPRAEELVGMTCLARGADQVFADVVLELGGALAVVVPAEDYFTSITDPASRERCGGYLDAATSTVTVDFEESGPAAYLAASRYLVDRCDVLLAVWDGGGGSGTADAVSYARDRGRPVVVIRPDAARHPSTISG